MAIAVYIKGEVSLSMIKGEVRDEFIKDIGLGTPLITGYDTKGGQFLLFSGGEAELEGLSDKLKKYPFFESAAIDRK